jgi:hypothetical protein
MRKLEENKKQQLERLGLSNKKYLTIKMSIETKIAVRLRALSKMKRLNQEDKIDKIIFELSVLENQLTELCKS